MTTHSDAIAAITLLETLPNPSGLPEIGIEISYHETSPEAAEAIVRAFPNLRWESHGSGSTEWLCADSNGLSINLFLKTPYTPRQSTIGERVLEAARS